MTSNGHARPTPRGERRDARTSPGAMIPPPPRQLGVAAAARLGFRRVLSSVLFMVGGIFLLVGVVFAAILIPIVLRDRALARDGAAATATVTAKRAYTYRDRDGDRRRAYEISYEFRLPDGRVWADTKDISNGRWNRLEEGSPVEVRYDPRNPDRHVLPGADGGFMLWFAPLFPGIFIVLGAILTRIGVREVLTPLRLYREGYGAIGQVTDFDEVANERINGRHPVRVRYAFSDPAGTAHEGDTKTTDFDLLERLEVGSPVTVLFDSRDPSRSVLYAALGEPDPAMSTRREDHDRT